MRRSFEDAAAFEGTDEQKLAKFGRVRDQIAKRIKDWLAEQLRTLVAEGFLRHCDLYESNLPCYYGRTMSPPHSATTPNAIVPCDQQ